ncbi:MAG: transglycosylase SLT domain-containing protein [Alistipes sp.]|nr:transglycosylase SLT domain-containing protein [Alistipes sp.]
MKTLRILLSLLLTLAVCAEEAEAQTRFKQLFQRKKRVPKERVLKSVKVDSIPVADSVSAVQIVRTESVAAEQQDSVATPQSKEKPYNPYLNVTLTPAQMDSLVARWDESQNALAFDNFFANYIALDSLSTGAASLPDSVYESRLRALASPIQLPYNPIVKNYINRYTDTRYGTINRILSLSHYYFPIIEEELLRAGLPVELRAMPIIESALATTAVSPRGAAGLWQFMPYTGKSYGLEVNSLVDERRDAVLATRAACKYLRDLYGIYNDWTLAIAAYNCGPGNVNKALARAGADCKTYWDIYYYLPPETRGYVPAFIGASYAFAYHKKHNIEYEPSPLPIATDTITVRRIMHLGQVASTLDVPIEVLRRLNPQYKLDIIPATNKSYALTLPTQFVSAYIEREAEIFSKDSTYLKEYINPANIDKKRLERPGFTYTVKSGDTLSGIANRYRVSVKNLMRWNGLRSANRLRVGQKLRIERGL